MNLNIKNEETYKLAAKLAELTNETMTKAVTIALRECIDRLRQRKQKATVAEMMEIGKRCADYIKESISSVDHGDLLYDDQGLPK
jgi:antitoxin VapB